MERLQVFLNETLRWSRLRTVGNSPVVRSSIIMPLVGYLLLLNQQALSLVDVDPRFRFVVSDNPWRLVLFYYGSFFLGIASTIYIWRCPMQIRKYDSAVEYFKEEADYLFQTDRAGYLQQKVRDDYNELQEWKADRIPRFYAQTTMQALDREASDHLSTLITIDWHIKDMSGTFWRAIAALLYSVGFLVIGIPALVTFLGVTAYALQIFFI